MLPPFPSFLAQRLFTKLATNKENKVVLRTFQTAIVCGYVFALAGTAQANPESARPVPSDLKYLVLDNRIIESTERTRLVLGKVEKDPHNPFYGQDKPWEVRIGNFYPNVLYDEEQRIYKCWYTVCLIDEVTASATDEIMDQITYPEAAAKGGAIEVGVCYATSKDGITWEKPDLGIIEFDGSKANNIVIRRAHGAGVFKDLQDPQPGRRYKLFTRSCSDRLVLVAFSADGLHWSEPIPCPEIDADGDTHNNTFWDERLGTYVGITRLWNEAGRVVVRTESRDYLKWTKAQEVLRGLESHLQPYGMPVFPYGNVYLGLVTIFNNRTGFVDCELAWSPDTVHWHRVCPGTPFIPRGAKGSYDAGCIYPADDPILRDGQLLLYYGGSVGTHADWAARRKARLCLARLRVDGFAAIEPAGSSEPGIVVTRPITCAGNKLQVSADAAGGSLRVAVLDSEGFGLADCQPINADVTDGVVTWQGDRDLASLSGKPIQLKFELRGAKLYAFGFGH
jgi:hypothetical protein